MVRGGVLRQRLGRAGMSGSGQSAVREFVLGAHGGEVRRRRLAPPR